MTYFSEVMADSPAAFYRLNETSGTSAADASGNGQTGTYEGGPTLGATGLIAAGTAVSFDGSNDDVLIAGPLGIATATSPISIEAWIKTTTTTTSSFVSGRASVQDSPNLDFGVLNTGKLYIQPRDNFRVGLITLQSPGAVNDGSPHHVVATRNTSKLWTLYIDGSSVATQSDGMTSPCTGLDWAYIARERRQAVFFSGVVDEVAIYHSTLSSTRVAAHYAARTDPVLGGSSSIKTVLGVSYPSNVKTALGLAQASVKTIEGLA